MSGVPRPNYTQVPHALLDDLLPDIDTLAELKIAMVIARATFGWHKDREVLSLSRLQTLTGMRRESVVAGLRRAVERGYVRKIAVGQGFAYGLVMSDELVREPDQLGTAEGSADRTTAGPQTGPLASPVTGPQIKKGRKKPSGGEKDRASESLFDEDSSLGRVEAHLRQVASNRHTPMPQRAALQETLVAFPRVDAVGEAEEFAFWALHGNGARRQIKSIAGTFRNWLRRANESLPVQTSVQSGVQTSRDWNKNVEGAPE